MERDMAQVVSAKRHILPSTRDHGGLASWWPRKKGTSSDQHEWVSRVTAAISRSKPPVNRIALSPLSPSRAQGLPVSPQIGPDLV